MTDLPSAGTPAIDATRARVLAGATAGSFVVAALASYVNQYVYWKPGVGGVDGRFAYGATHATPGGAEMNVILVGVAMAVVCGVWIAVPRLRFLGLVAAAAGVLIVIFPVVRINEFQSYSTDKLDMVVDPSAWLTMLCGAVAIVLGLVGFFTTARSDGSDGAAFHGEAPAPAVSTSRASSSPEATQARSPVSGSQPPAGWMEAPGEPGMLRYWDGEAWTEHRTAKQ